MCFKMTPQIVKLKIKEYVLSVEHGFVNSLELPPPSEDLDVDVLKNQIKSHLSHDEVNWDFVAEMVMRARARNKIEETA
jgi:hypothetical protein